MTLRRKTIYIIIGIFVALLVVLNLVSWVFIQGSYDNLEKDNVRESVSRALNTFGDNITQIDTTCRDWAFWDDTYAFISDANETYAKSNLDIWALENLELDIIVYIDIAGEIVFGKSFDYLAGEELPLPSDLLEQLKPGLPLLKPAAEDEGIMGVLLLDDSPVLVASEPILTSQGEGPSRGVLIMGRFLDSQEIEKIAEMGRQDIDIVRFNEDPLEEPYREVRTGLQADGEAEIRVLGSDSIAGYTVIDDIYGNPALILSVEMPRSIHKQGVSTLIYFHIFLLIACLAFAVSVVLILERIVLSRLSSLNAEITEIGRTGDPSARVEVRGKDELANLSSSINTMMDHLEGSEERFRSLIENALDMIAILGPDGRSMYESPSIEKILGYERGYFEERDVFELMHPDDVEGIRLALEELMQNPGDTRRVELRFRHRKGHWRHLVVIGYNLLDDPHVGGIVINVRDTTSKVVALERLEKINRLFQGLGADPGKNMRMIVRSSRDILGLEYAAYCRSDGMRYFSISTEPAKNSPVEVYDPEGYLCFDIVDKDLKEPMIIGDITAEGFIDTSPHFRKYGYGFFVGYPVVLARKTVGCLSLYGSSKRPLLSEELEILGTLAHALGVEEERIANERNIKEFLDIASHELRHPITLMKGYALTLRDYEHRLEEASRREFLDIMNRCADRMENLVRELLDVSRIEGGRLALDRHSASIELLINRAVSEIKEKDWGCDYAVSVDEGLPALRIDPEKILRVLVILLDNACEHSPEGATIFIDAKREDGDVLVSIIDRGVGVPEEDREHIFERFHQVKDAVRPPSSGMGLGLYIAREIVEAHGGRIWYEPNPNGGSVFRFALPLSDTSDNR